MVREFSTYSGGGLLNRRKNREAAQRTIQPIILTGIAATRIVAESSTPSVFKKSSFTSR
jgi:hypothetical protein